MAIRFTIETDRVPIASTLLAIADLLTSGAADADGYAVCCGVSHLLDALRDGARSGRLEIRREDAKDLAEKMRITAEAIDKYLGTTS